MESARIPNDLRQVALWLMPLFALLTTFAVLQTARLSLGPRVAYSIGLLFYWLVWCLAVPISIVGVRGVRSMFGPSRQELTLRHIILLVLPPVIGFSTLFPLLVWIGSARVYAAAATIAIVNGTLEEVLWRGVYLEVFRRQWWSGVIYPAITFGLWHVAPVGARWTLSPTIISVIVLAAALVGLSYSVVARHTRSIRWTVLSHILMNFAGLGVLAYFA
jgi:membrane protease YdiL (CAAX protease family)